MKPSDPIPDPIIATCDIIRDGLTGAAVTNHRPTPNPSKPHVSVQIDGDTLSTAWGGRTLHTRVLLRVAVWAFGPDAAHEAYDLAQQCQMLLLAHSGDPIAGFRSNSGPLPATDHETGDEFAWFMVTARIKATVS